MSTAAMTVKERPIIMQAHSVRAILEGRKTMTRRVVKPQPVRGCWGAPMGPDDWAWKYPKSVATRISCKPNGPDGWEEFCPYGSVGDRLWVKEAWRPKSCAGHLNEDDGSITITYPADGAEIYLNEYADKVPADWTIPKATNKGPLTPLFMPRWASRLTLEITGVRVERLWQITEADVLAEGIKPLTLEPKRTFIDLWDEINGKRPGCAWKENPWVWVVEFRKADER